MNDVHRQLVDLLECSGAKLHRLLTRITLRQDIAEELLQEVFVKLIEISKVKEIRNWEAYARRAAMNLAFSWRQRHKTCGVSLDSIAEPICDADGPESGLVMSERIQEVLEVIGKLNGSARHAFVMRYIEQASYKEIASEFGRTEQQVRAVCSRAMKFVRVQLGPRGSSHDRKDINYA